MHVSMRSLAAIVLGIVSAFVASSCGVPVGDAAMRKYEPPVREWTIVAYMCADNDLEESAIEDLNEMEAVDWSSGSVTLLALVDRAEGNDSSNGDWKDTRLYRIVTDPLGDNQTVVSERIPCPPLGITSEGVSELNMSNPLTLSRVIDFAMAAFPSKNTALIVWGHGTGWRSMSSRGATLASDPIANATRAVAIDESSSGYMSVPDFGAAIRDKGLALIGFDTCFASTVELLYQIRSDARLFVGSIGAEPQNGWAYDRVFGRFLSGEASGDAFCDAVIGSFAADYAGNSGTSISKVELPRIGDLVADFDALSRAVALGIVSPVERDVALDAMLETVSLYRGPTYPTDCFADIGSFAESFEAAAGGFPNSAEIRLRSSEVSSALLRAVPVTWRAEGGWMAGGMCVNFIPFMAGNTPLFPHDSAYVRGSGATGQSAFVSDGRHWAPNATPNADSFLDKVFYYPF